MARPLPRARVGRPGSSYVENQTARRYEPPDRRPAETDQWRRYSGALPPENVRVPRGTEGSGITADTERSHAKPIVSRRLPD